MGEFFELTFFAKHGGKTLEELQALQEIMGVEEGRHITPRKNSFPFLSDRSLYFVAFAGLDFNEYELSVEGVLFTKENFDIRLTEMLDLMEAVFYKCPSIDFATGVYEITDSCLEDVVCFDDLLQDRVLSQFPFLFCHKPEHLHIATMEKRGTVWYGVQQGEKIQNVFTRQKTRGKTRGRFFCLDETAEK